MCNNSIYNTHTYVCTYACISNHNIYNVHNKYTHILYIAYTQTYKVPALYLKSRTSGRHYILNFVDKSHRFGIFFKY